MPDPRDLGAVFQFDFREADLRRRLAVAVHAIMRTIDVKRIALPLNALQDADDEEIVWTQSEDTITLERRPRFVRCPTCGVGYMLRENGV